MFFFPKDQLISNTTKQRNYLRISALDSKISQREINKKIATNDDLGAFDMIR